ncbi:outer membrane protein [Candidatus Protochlamydia phocaeensis]|uniref:outer membrane protein n=1 Tax=Candidatus Protochlamydia phocaeensis TaxID=1414722 RepID=UPI000838797E|nr:outer membrane beta-barrel protein [Candidatus Protochlamydia phocaeensis]
MKKFIFICLLVMGSLFTHFAHALLFDSLGKGVYAGVRGGVCFSERQSHSHATFKFEPGYYLGGAIGYQLCYLRFEGEVNYQRTALDTVKLGFHNPRIHGATSTWSCMGNGLFYLPVYLFVQPYIGAGIGYAHTHTHWNYKSTDSWIFGYAKRKHDSTQNGLAGQLIVGLSYPLLCDTDLGLEYRYFRQDKDVKTHRLGLTFNLVF